jgi:hypothetical protein
MAYDTLRNFLDFFQKGDREKQLAKKKFSCTVMLRTQVSCTDAYVRSKGHVTTRLF